MNRIFLGASLGFLSVFITSTISFAGEDEKVAVKAAALTDPSLTALAQSEDPQVTLEASKDGSVAAGRIGFSLKQWTTSLVLKAPVSSGQTEADLANLDGLSAGATASISATREFRVDSEGKGASIYSGLTGVCERYNKKLLGEIEESRPNWSRIDIKKGECTVKTLLGCGSRWASQARMLAENALAETCLEFNLSTPNRKQHLSILQFEAVDLQATAGHPTGQNNRGCTQQQIQSLGTEWNNLFIEKLKSKLKPVCEAYNSPPVDQLTTLTTGECSYSALKEKGPRWQLRALRASKQKPWFLTFDISASQTDFKFIEPTGEFEEQTTTKYNKGLSAALGTFRSGIFYSLSYRHETVFKAAKKVELCQPIPGTGAFSCSETALAGPTEVNRKILGFDVKSYIFPMIAGNLRILYDFEKQFWNPHLFFFFIPSKGSGLNLGVDLAFSTLEDEHFTARLFLGASFKLRSSD